VNNSDKPILSSIARKSEARALTNADLLLVLHQQELDDSVHCQKLRLKWERSLKQPPTLSKPQNEKLTTRKP